MTDRPEKLKSILERIKNKRVIVWGDLILDEYIYTSTGRVSREAPVLVTEWESTAFKAGGAGNVVMNIKTLGAFPTPLAFTGAQADGLALKNILRENGITTDYLIEWEGYNPPKKSRILSGSENTRKQQILRIDTLNRSDIEEEHYRKIEKHLRELLPQHDLLLISDYLGESVKADLAARIRAQFPEKMIIIDSRDNLLDFTGIDVATPNELEIKKIFPNRKFQAKEDFYMAGQELIDALQAEGIVLKRGHKGMIVFEKGRRPRDIDIHGSPDIVDVTGAGDTVIAVIGLALAGGADLFSAARLANIAAGIAVMKEGAYPLGFQELADELE